MTDKASTNGSAWTISPTVSRNTPTCWTWYKYWDEILDTSDAPCFKWFKGGQDQRQLQLRRPPSAKDKKKTAIHFVPEPLEEEKVRAHHLSGALCPGERDGGPAQGFRRTEARRPGHPASAHDAELPITMLACARLGVIHSQVFGGFSGTAAADRIVDSGSRVLITMDAYYRGGNLLDHKQKADIACRPAAKDGQKVDKVLVWQRYAGKYSAATPMVDGRDFFVNDELKTFTAPASNLRR
jgi:acetyl-CoA synthetase